MEDEVRVAIDDRRRSGDRPRRGTRHGRAARLPPTRSDPDRHRHLGGRAQHRRARRPRRDRPQAVRGRRPLRPRRDRQRRGAGHPRRRGGAPRRLQRKGRPRPRPARRAAPHGRVRDRVERRQRHDGDDEEVEVPRRARAPARGAPPACAERAAREPVEWGVATRCRRGEATSGDLAVVTLLPEGALVAAIDGLGHGGEAARAARRAGEVVRESPSRDLVLLVERCHAALQGTRGAAISLAFVSPSESTMTWLGVGNVEGRVLSGDPSATRPKGSLALGSGVPGHELPPVRAATLDAAARRRPRPGHRRDRGRLRGLARHLRLDSGDQRAHPGRPLEAHGRRPRGGGPLPRRAAMTAARHRRGAVSRGLRVRSARTICCDPSEALAARRVRARRARR